MRPVARRDRWDTRSRASRSPTLAPGGAEALALATADPPEAIVLDVMMPGMDGPATLRALREREETAGVPVVMLTAKAQAADLDALRALGVAGIVAKPFDPMMLAQELAEAARAAHTLAGSLGTLGRPVAGAAAQELAVLLAGGSPADPERAAQGSIRPPSNPAKSLQRAESGTAAPAWQRRHTAPRRDL